MNSSDVRRPVDRFVGGMRTQVLQNATWPFVAIEISSAGVSVRPRGPARWLLSDADYAWSEIITIEPAKGVGSRGVRFDTARGAFVFWTFQPGEVLGAAERAAPPGVVKRTPPRRIWLSP